MQPVDGRSLTALGLSHETRGGRILVLASCPSGSSWAGRGRGLGEDGVQVTSDMGYAKARAAKYPAVLRTCTHLF